MLSYWKSPLPLKKNLFATETPLTSKKSSLYCQYCNQIEGLPSFWSPFLPTILWERCLFSMAYVSLWIFGSMTPRSVRSTKLKFQSVANQFYWVSQSKPPRVLSKSRWKPTNKMINVKIFNISVVSLKMMIFFISWQLLVKTIFVGCRMSSFICKICSTKLDLQTLWECCLLSKKLLNQFDWNIHLWSDLSITCWDFSDAKLKDLRFLTTFLIPLNLLKGT